MNINQRNKLNMYITVLQFLANNTAIWSTLVAFADAVTLLTNKVAELQAQVAIQSMQIVGYAAAKKGKKNDLVTKLLVVTGALKAYATVINDPVLFAFADFTKSDLKKQGDNILTQTANNIHSKATSLLASLGSYGIDVALLTQLQTMITDYANFVESPRLARIAKKTATTNIKSLVKEIDGILKTVLDMLIVQFKVTASDFFNGYNSAREIIDLGHHHLPLILTGTVNSGQILNVINATNPRWVAGVTFKIKNTTTGGSSSGSGLYFYPANAAGDGWSGQGSFLMPGQEETHTLTAAEFKNFLNVQNQSGNEGTFEITIL